MASSQLAIVLVSFHLLQFLSGVNSANFTIINKCDYTIWPGFLTDKGTSQLPTTGFPLQADASKTLDIPTPWAGRIWGRTYCTQDSTGNFTCSTGDCGSSTIECAGGGAMPPATLAEFALNSSVGVDFYDVNLVNGYNLPMTVAAQSGSGSNCTTTGCVADLNGECPAVKVIDGNETVACKSGCLALGNPKYCQHQTNISEFFKAACPRAYSYSFDDRTSTFTCVAADYVITFCPLLSTSVNSNNGQNPVVAVEVSAGTHSTSMNFIAGFVVVTAAIWQLGELYMTLPSH